MEDALGQTPFHGRHETEIAPGLDVHWPPPAKPGDGRYSKEMTMDGRGDWPNFERGPAVVAPVLSLFLEPPSPHILMAARIMWKTA